MSVDPDGGLIERMAIAIWQTETTLPPETWKTTSKGMKAAYRTSARAAFTAAGTGVYLGVAPTDAQIAAFKTEWEAADREGQEGNRVARGLVAASEALYPEH